MYGGNQLELNRDDGNFRCAFIISHYEEPSIKDFVSKRRSTLFMNDNYGKIHCQLSPRLLVWKETKLLHPVQGNYQRTGNLFTELCEKSNTTETSFLGSST
jgi:hypothetical protein